LAQRREWRTPPTGQQIVTDQKGAVLQHQVTDRLYETFVTLQ
jgi:hypothetical protein